MKPAAQDRWSRRRVVSLILGRLKDLKMLQDGAEAIAGAAADVAYMEVGAAAQKEAYDNARFLIRRVIRDLEKVKETSTASRLAAINLELDRLEREAASPPVTLSGKEQ